jgi:hypothetical protein
MDTRSTDAESRSEAAPSPSRRAALGAALGAAASLAAGARPARAGQHGPPLATRDPLAFLVSRTSFGYTREEHALAQGLGYAGWLEHQLDHLAIDDSQLDLRLASLPTLGMTSKQIHDAYGFGGTLPAFELKWAAAQRAVHSKRQLFERMVELWSDHFSIDHALKPLRNLKTADDRDVVRAHALGKFPDLLRASAHSGAMLVYLDNVTNTQAAPQENYARELLELHTLGVDGPYTEADVKELARALTGWQIAPESAPDYGAFRFAAADHDPGAKVVLGLHLMPNGGQADGEAVLDLLAAHPATAAFVARKLVTRLLTSNPPQALVDAVRDVYLATGGDIKDMIRAVLAPANLALVDPWSEPRFRRPFELCTALLRAFRLDFTGFIQLYGELAIMGHVPFGWPSPNGYPDTIGAWGSNLLSRWTFVSRLFDGGIQHVHGTRQAVMQRLAATGAAPLAQQINVVLTGGAISRADTNRVQAWVDSFPSVDWTVVREAIALMACSPSYQFH